MHPTGGLVVVGAGGLGREVAEHARQAGVGPLLGFLDDDPARQADPKLPGPWLGPVGTALPPGARVVLAVGNARARARLAARLPDVEWTRVVHPSATVCATSELAPGVTVGPQSYVGPEAVLGPHALVNHLVAVAHDAVVGECSVLSPFVALNGHSRLGARVFVGTAAVVQVGVEVGDDSKVSAGAHVWEDVPARCLAAGAPATARPKYPAFPGPDDLPA